MPPPSANRSPARRLLPWLYPVALGAMIVLASGRSEVAAPGIIGIDKVAHFAVFGLLGTILVRSRPLTRAWPFGAIFLVSFFGLTDELHQSFTPGRFVEFADWIADTAGATLAVTLYVNWPAYRRLLEFPLRLPRRRASAKPAPALSAKLAS